MRIQADYSRFGFQLCQGYRILIVSECVVIYLNMKIDKTKKYNLKMDRYKRFIKRYKLYRFEPVIHRGINE